MNKNMKIGDTLTGLELISLYDNIQNDEFAEDCKIFKLIKVNKEIIYSARPNGCSSWKNLKTFNDWLNAEDNYDFYHTDTVYDMVKLFREGKDLPPLIVDTEYGLYDGQHRLTAYSMIDSIEDIFIFKELKNE